MQLPYDDVAQILQFRHLAHGATHGLDIVEQHEQQDDGANLRYFIFRNKVICRIPSTKRFLVFVNSVILRLWKGTTRMLFPYEFGKTGR